MRLSHGHSGTTDRPRVFPVLTTTHGDDETRTSIPARVWGDMHDRFSLTPSPHDAPRSGPTPVALPALGGGA